MVTAIIMKPSIHQVAAPCSLLHLFRYETIVTCISTYKPATFR